MNNITENAIGDAIIATVAVRFSTNSSGTDAIIATVAVGFSTNSSGTDAITATVAVGFSTNNSGTDAITATVAVGFSTNSSGTDAIANTPGITTVTIVRYIGNLLVVIFSVIYNILTITAVLTTDRLKTKTNAILTSLTFADIGCAFMLLLFIGYSSVLGGDYVCRGSLFKSIVMPLIQIPFFASSLHLILVAVDRYLAVVFPLRYDVILIRSRTAALIAGTWLLFVVLVLNYYAGFLHSATARWCTVTINFVYESVISGGLYFAVAFLLVILYGQIISIASRHKKEIRRYQQIQMSAASTSGTAADGGGQSAVVVDGNGKTKAKKNRGARMIAASSPRISSSCRRKLPEI